MNRSLLVWRTITSLVLLIAIWLPYAEAGFFISNVSNAFVALFMNVVYLVHVPLLVVLWLPFYAGTIGLLVYLMLSGSCLLSELSDAWMPKSRWLLAAALITLTGLLGALVMQGPEYFGWGYLLALAGILSAVILEGVTQITQRKKWNRL